MRQHFQVTPAANIRLLAITLSILTIGVGQQRAQAADAPKLPVLHIAGTRIVDGSNKTVALRGVNLGTWLLVESHFSGFTFEDEKSLRDKLEQRFGADKTREIFDAYRAAWIAEDDFTRIKELGFNHVRVPFYYGLLESDAKPGVYRDDGWKWLDKAVDGSEKAGLYCILDLHGAPGGQSTAEHTGEKNHNIFWTDTAMQNRAIALWTAVAKRYRGRSCIAAFDLLNEPMGAPNGKVLVTGQLELAHAIRKVDPGRLVIVEDGYKGLQNFGPLTGADKAGVIYSQHNYPTMTKPASPDTHEQFLKERFPAFAKEQARFAQPLYIGEWNVIQEASGGGPMARKHIEAMDKQGWSWALWIYKQANKSPVRECWSIVRNDKSIDMPNIETDTAEQIIAKFDQLKSSNMVVYEPLKKAMAGDK